jgi:hypothetical protein
MPTQVPRERKVSLTAPIPAQYMDSQRGSTGFLKDPYKLGVSASRLWRSEGHPIDRKTGKRMGGGPFHVTHVEDFHNPAYVTEVNRTTNGIDWFYTGPLYGTLVLSPALSEAWNGTAADWNETSMKADGTTAISQCAPTNPTVNLGTSLAETFREGIPSLPGIQSWKNRAQAAKAAGSEYLNYQFGWHPLTSEVHGVVNAARHHRDIMQNYRHNEGSDIHRRFDFPSETLKSITVQNSNQYFGDAYLASFASFVAGEFGKSAVCSSTYKKVRHRWFEGCFSYGGPAKADSFGRAIGFGQEADAVYGLALTPDTLWELTPWSWAIDWFTNAGDVINNVSNFAAAGLVMRYGFMMEETIEEYRTDYSGQEMKFRTKSTTPKTYARKPIGPCSVGKRVVSKSRVPASPFGFGVGWEGLSPTQLAITAAIGITRLL